jgi:hypothetical protein
MLFYFITYHFFFRNRSAYRSADFVRSGELMALSLVLQTPRN